MTRLASNTLNKATYLFLVLLLMATASVASAAGKKKFKKSPATPDYKNDMLAAADLKHGKSLLVGCTACHTFTKGVKPLAKQDIVTQRVFMGPNLYGIFGKKMATGEYPYSKALKKLKKAGKTWTVDELYKWLRSPSIYAPGTYMVFVGMGDPQDRLDLIAYLKTLER
jgi:cytochrome c